MVTKFILKIVIFLFLLINVSFLDASPRLKRVCVSLSGDITVSWFPFTDVCNGVENVIIFARPNPLSAYKAIDSFKVSNQYEYVHKKAKNTHSNGNYFIQYVLNCNGRKIVTSDTLKIDITPPDVIDPDSISVNNGDVVLGWKPSSADDAKGYVIYRTVASQNFPVDTVFGKESTFYRNTRSGNPNIGEERFKIAVLDSCDNISVSGKFHQTIFLKLSQDACKKEIYLNWKSYEGWQNGVDKYYVWAWDDKGTLEKSLVATLPGNQLNYIFKNGLASTKYTFVIQAVKKGNSEIKSSSNEIDIKTSFSAPLDYIFLKNISIQGQNAKLVWEVSEFQNLSYFRIKYGKDSTLLNDSFTINAGANNVSEFTDDNIDVNREIKFYKVAAYDKCGNFAGETKVSRNIVACVTKVKGGRLIQWNSYINFPGGVNAYEIFRTFNSANPQKWQQISSVEKNTFTFLDTDSLEDEGNESICYYIKALEAKEGNHFFNSESFSNYACYFEDALVKVPNAFVFNGINPEFKPVTMFTDLTRSSMKIYNRWGQVIFETNNLYKGWDGKLNNGEKAPQGIYFYTITAVGRNLKQQSFSGKITLL